MAIEMKQATRIDNIAIFLMAELLLFVLCQRAMAYGLPVLIATDPIYSWA
jgi:hypothetical protein